MKLEASITSVMVMTEMKKPRDTFILGRGQYDNPGEKVTPGVPAFLPPLPPGAPPNRLFVGEVVGGPEESADGAGGGEPLLAGLLWRRDCEDGGGFWLARRAAQPSAIARLDGYRVRQPTAGT